MLSMTSHELLDDHFWKKTAMKIVVSMFSALPPLTGKNSPNHPKTIWVNLWCVDFVLELLLPVEQGSGGNYFPSCPYHRNLQTRG
jgi:hypothetical protein